MLYHVGIMTRSEIVHHSRTSEDRILVWLRMSLKSGAVCRMNRSSPFDAVCCGKRVEFKAGTLRNDGTWLFNIHRHGVVNESQVDVYVLRLEDVPGFKYAVHLIVPAPLNTPTVSISLRSLLTRWGRFFNRFDFIDSTLSPPTEDSYTDE